MSKTVLLQTIQLSIKRSLNVKTVLFQTIQFSKSSQFSSIWLIVGPYQVLPLRARVDVEAIAMKEHSAFF